MSTKKPVYSILIVDDNPDDALLYHRILSNNHDAQYRFTNADLGEEGLESYHREKPDCVLLDYNLPDMDGIEFMQRLSRESESECYPVIMLTGQGNEAVVVEAMKNGVRDYLIKGQVTPESLRRSVGNVIENTVLERENYLLTKQLKMMNVDLKNKNKNKKLSELTETAHRFVDNVAHDFRTPLTVIKEFSSIIADGLGGPVTKQQNEYLQYIITAT